MSNRMERVEVFWGKVIAGYTHEIKNILATINESGGFVEDIYRLGKQDDPVYQRKIASSLEIIQDQVERGERLTSQLNTLAHSPDQELNRISLQEDLSVMIDLSQRFARRNNVILRQEETREQVVLTTNRLLFMHLVFVALDWSLAGYQAGGEILIRPQPGPAVCHVQIFCLGEDISREPGGNEWKLLQKLCRDLQGRLQWDDSDQVLTLTLPQALSTSE